MYSACTTRATHAHATSAGASTWDEKYFFASDNSYSSFPSADLNWKRIELMKDTETFVECFWFNTETFANCMTRTTFDDFLNT